MEPAMREKFLLIEVHTHLRVAFVDLHREKDVRLSTLGELVLTRDFPNRTETLEYVRYLNRP